MRTPLAVLLSLLPRLALSNGGPVAWGGEGPVGGVHPAQNLDVRLVSEDLRLALLPDAKGYRAKAAYVLSNAAGPRSVAFGVPVALLRAAEGEPREIGAKELAAIERRVRLQLAGKRVECKVVLGASLADGVAGRDQPVLAGDGEKPLDPDAWCVAQLQIPAGDAVPLLLEYDGELSFEDIETSKSALTGYDRRILRWALFPAGYWAGRPDRVVVRLDPGPFDGLVTAVPAPARTEGGALVWDLEKPDLKAMREIRATVDVEPVLRHRELSKSRTEGSADRGIVLRATASSTLASQGKASYAAASAVDHDASTAWCEGKAGSGIGEWIEVRVEKAGGGAPEGPCSLEGYALVPGYAKSQASWTGNNRVRAFRIGPCGGAGPSKVVELVPGAYPRSRSESPSAYGLSSRADRSALLVTEPLEDRACVRLTIEKVERGAADDTCISELRPVYNCG